MPEFDIDAALAAPASPRWGFRLRRFPNGGVTDCWLTYGDPDPAERKLSEIVAHDFRITVPKWKRERTNANTVGHRMTNLVAYLNQLSAEHPEKPYYPNYQHLSVWSWVMDVAGTLDDPSISLL